MTKKLGMLLLLLQLTALAQAQETNEFIYFNKTFWGDTMNIGSPIGKVLPDEYLLFGMYVGLDNASRIYVRKINQKGEGESQLFRTLGSGRFTY